MKIFNRQKYFKVHYKVLIDGVFKEKTGKYSSKAWPTIQEMIVVLKEWHGSDSAYLFDLERINKKEYRRL